MKPKESGNDSQAMVSDSNEFEFAVDNIDESPQTESGDTQSIEDTSTAKTNGLQDEFVEEVGTAPSEPKFEEFQVATSDARVKEYEIETPIAPLAIDTNESAEFQEYQVQSGDTLMMIGFKLFGDYRTWKDLKKWNNLSSLDLKKGTILRYRPKLSDSFAWRPNGEPHLVKRGEYLGSISYDKYGTSKRWKEIFQNNKPLLRDPNLIFAGFTIYYVPDKRSVASEK